MHRARVRARGRPADIDCERETAAPVEITRAKYGNALIETRYGVLWQIDKVD